MAYTGDPRKAPAGTVVAYWPNTGNIISEGNGKFYAIKNGKKQYVPPQVVMQGTDAGMADPESTKAQGAPSQSLLREAGHFDPNTGEWKQDINWRNITSMAVGGLLGGGIANAAMSGGAAPVAAPAAVNTTYGLTGAEFGGSAATGALPGAVGGASTVLPATSTVPNTGALVPATSSSLTPASTTPSYLDLIERGGKTATDLATGRAKGREAEAQLTNNANNTEIGLYRAMIDSNNAQNRYGLDAAGQENDFNTKTYGLDLDTANAANRFGLDKVNAGVNVGQLELAQKRYGLEAPGMRAGNAVRGDILANAQDASFNLPSTIPKMSINGGLRPSMFSANTRALGGEMSAQALAQQRAGDTFAPLPTLPDYQGPTGKLPTYKAPAPYVNPPPPPKMAPQPEANGVDTALNWAGYASLAAPYLKYFF